MLTLPKLNVIPLFSYTVPTVIRFQGFPSFLKPGLLRL
jgi:hypothetical protein